MDDRVLPEPIAVWVRTARFSAPDDVQPGLLYAWERDESDTAWRARVWSLRETAPGFRGPDFRGLRSAGNVWPRDPAVDWCEAIDGAVTSS